MVRWDAGPIGRRLCTGCRLPAFFLCGCNCDRCDRGSRAPSVCQDVDNNIVMHGPAMPAEATMQGPGVLAAAAVPGCILVDLEESEDEVREPAESSALVWSAVSTTQGPGVPAAAAVPGCILVDLEESEDEIREPAESSALEWSAVSTTQGPGVPAAAAVPGCILVDLEESDNEVRESGWLPPGGEVATQATSSKTPVIWLPGCLAGCLRELAGCLRAERLFKTPLPVIKTPPSPPQPRPILKDQALPVQALPVQATSGVMKDVECKVCNIWLPAHYFEDHCKSTRHRRRQYRQPGGCNSSSGF